MERDGERIEITISSRFENIELVQVIAEHLCENAGMDEDGSHWIGMAVREADLAANGMGGAVSIRFIVSAIWRGVVHFTRMPKIERLRNSTLVA